MLHCGRTCSGRWLRCFAFELFPPPLLLPFLVVRSESEHLNNCLDALRLKYKRVNILVGKIRHYQIYMIWQGCNHKRIASTVSYHCLIMYHCTVFEFCIYISYWICKYLGIIHVCNIGVQSNVKYVHMIFTISSIVYSWRHSEDTMYLLTNTLRTFNVH